MCGLLLLLAVVVDRIYTALVFVCVCELYMCVCACVCVRVYVCGLHVMSVHNTGEVHVRRCVRVCVCVGGGGGWGGGGGGRWG